MKRKISFTKLATGHLPKVRYFRCTTGKTTKSFRAYRSSWSRIINPLEKITGMKCVAFDPGIDLAEFANGQRVNGSTVQLPLWFAKRLIERHK